MVLLLLAAAAGRSLASETAERLYSRGLVLFHAENYSQALDLFERAVAADPKDPYAVYYRGVTEARLGNYDKAVQSLGEALTLKPDLAEAHLEMGAALFETGRYQEAVGELQQAQAVPELDAHASLFLGLTQLRLGQQRAAEDSFSRAAARDPALEVPSAYYHGVIAYQEHRWSDAISHFDQVVAKSPTSEMGREADAFLRKIRTSGHRRYQLYARAGLQYDSNVSLAPNNDVIDVGTGQTISQQADGRASFTAGGSIIPWRNDHIQLTTGYELYQSLYFQETDFNLQDHRPSVQLTGTWDMFQLGALGRYDYYFLAGDSFLQEVTALPWITVSEGGLGEIELFYRMRWHDFYMRELSDLRDGFNHAAGIHQLFALGKGQRYFVFGYEYQHENPTHSEGQVFGNDAHQGDVGLGWSFPFRIGAELIYAFRHQDYSSQSASFQDPVGIRRRDNQHRVVLDLGKQLNDYLWLDATYFGTFNRSNKSSFEYDRNLVSLELEVRF